MLDKSAQLKFSHVYHDRTARQTGDSNENSFAVDVEVERQYVERLKSQREKVNVY
jgi:hypothetical protein